MRSNHALIVCILALAAWARCGRPLFSEREHDHGDEGTSVTLWSARAELFMEYPRLEAGKEAAFLIHLTVVEGFKPLGRGPVTLEFAGPSGQVRTFSAASPSRPGIFTPHVRLPGGKHTLTLGFDIDGVAERFVVPDIQVGGAARPGQEIAGAISFLKEQQWLVPFMTSLIEKRPMRKTALVHGKVIPRAGGRVVISSPFSGMVVGTDGAGIPVPGMDVAEGDSLALILPNPEATTAASLKAQVDMLSKMVGKAEKEAKRLEGLFLDKAVSQRDYDDALTLYAIKQSELALARKQLDLYRSQQTATFRAKKSGEGFMIRAPFSGRISESFVAAKQYVQAGDPLLVLANLDAAWIRLNVPPALVASLVAPLDILIQKEGDPEKFGLVIAPDDMLLIGGEVHEGTRTVPVTIEVPSSVHALILGSYVTGEIGMGNPVETLAIEEGAVIEDDGVPVCYVQAGGETFIKRPLTLGIRHGGFVQVLSGLEPGERVVSEGAYKVKLASAAVGEAGHGHAH
ncbi:MAG: efflux RND transporter periplasmic adaptor subunit [Candidatus Aminicenantes bacterium]|nr:efflux RND transporter periplasmic adaptor subunit [Candidatus Aminicenantes bacterium]